VLAHMWFLPNAKALDLLGFRVSTPSLGVVGATSIYDPFEGTETKKLNILLRIFVKKSEAKSLPQQDLRWHGPSSRVGKRFANDFRLLSTTSASLATSDLRMPLLVHICRELARIACCI
jgi:hypothetical protein